MPDPRLAATAARAETVRSEKRSSSSGGGAAGFCEEVTSASGQAAPDQSWGVAPRWRQVPS
jgi:hypothetical protein